MSRLKVLDLFSGIGGFSLGLDRTGGFETVAFCEINPFCRQVLAKHWPKVQQYDDVRSLTAERLAADGLAVDVICGGFPCQDISLAGAGAGLEGERSGLWSEIARLVGEIRPGYVIVENVSALLGRGLGSVLGDLAALGYDAEWHCIPASYAGLRQLRDRVWIVAYPQRHGVQRGAHFTAAWCEKSREEQLAGLVQPSAWPTISGARDRGTGHGVPNGTHRNRAIGNAVVPQIRELIGRAILTALQAPASRRMTPQQTPRYGGETMTTPEVLAAVERVTALSAGNKSWANKAATAQQSYDLREDAKAIDTILSALAEAQGSLDEHALFDAETDLAFKDLDAEIADLKEALTTSEARRVALEAGMRIIADGTVSSAPEGHYLAHRAAVKIARTLLNPQQEGSRDHG